MQEQISSSNKAFLTGRGAEKRPKCGFRRKEKTVPDQKGDSKGKASGKGQRGIQDLADVMNG